MNSNRIVSTKIFDEGASSPFPARLILQMCQLRDSLIRDNSMKVDFDKVYAPVLENFQECKLAVHHLKELKNQHIKEVEEGTAVKFHPNGQISIIRTIDDKYRASFKEFFIKGEMVVNGIPRVGEVFGLKTAFFFKKEPTFRKGVEELKKDWNSLAEFIINHLENARLNWYDNFNKIRNDIEHRAIKISKTTYSLNSESKVQVIFPTSEAGVDLVDVLDSLLEKLLELVEACIVFFFSTKLKPGYFIKDIPVQERNPSMVVRYKLYIWIGDQMVPCS
jgi:hypothetical protein